MKEILIAEIGSTRFAQQYDINKNQINDATEREKMKIAHDAIQKDRDRELDLKKHKDEVRLKEKEIKTKASKQSK